MPILEVLRQDTEAVSPWGKYTESVQTAFRFWEWWDNDPDADMCLDGSSVDVLMDTIIKGLPADPGAERSAEVIVRATRMLTNDPFNEEGALMNDILFSQTTGEPFTVPEGIGADTVETLQEFARLRLEGE